MLNNDTEVDPGFLEPLVDAMLENPKIGMVGSKVHYYYEENTIQFAGATPMTRFYGNQSFHRKPAKKMKDNTKSKNQPLLLREQQ